MSARADAFGPVLPREFYARKTVRVARDLVGRVLVHEREGEVTAGRIVEVEAYLGQGDRAAHSAAGRTPRTAHLFGEPGYAYVYVIYGMHHCLNFVCEPDGTAGCVLLRAVEPMTGVAGMWERRPKARREKDLTSGPAKLTAAFGIDLGQNKGDLVSGPVRIHAGAGKRARLDVSERIGIREDAELPLRFTMRGSQFLSR